MRAKPSLLGKDEVASSNLASSSKASEIFWFQRLSFVIMKNRRQIIQCANRPCSANGQIGI